MSTKSYVSATALVAFTLGTAICFATQGIAASSALCTLGMAIAEYVLVHSFASEETGEQ